MTFHSIKEAIDDISNGKMIIVVDDENRENEGDLVMAADKVNTESINFMIRFAKGLVCVPVTDYYLDRLDLKDMVINNKDVFRTAFTVSVDASEKHGVSTGISASDRAKTIKTLISKTCGKDDLVSPGHIFPLRARQMGVLRRAGHTEAAVDLARLAGLSPAGVICEIINDDGSMARVDDLIVFSKKNNIKIITIKDLIEYRLKQEHFVEKREIVNMPTHYGNFKLHSFKDILNDKLHLALVKGDISDKKPVLVRVHSECCTGDIFSSLRCDCGDQLKAAMKRIEKEGSGVILYLRQEGRGIGLENKLKSYVLQEQGYDTVEANKKLGFNADLREYGIGAQILRSLGLSKLKLMTNNPKKVIGLDAYGLEISSQEPIIIKSNKYNRKYMETKRDELGHKLT